jgi:hypothetical protein
MFDVGNARMTPIPPGSSEFFSSIFLYEKEICKMAGEFALITKIDTLSTDL